MGKLFSSIIIIIIIGVFSQGIVFDFLTYIQNDSQINDNSNHYNSNYLFPLEENFSFVHPNNSNTLSKLTMLSSNGAIVIQNNNELAIYSNSGNGSKEAPFVIENFNISVNTSNTNAISIKNSDSYFILRNNTLMATGSLSNGINFENVSNGLIQNNTISNSYDSIRIINSNDNIFKSNVLSGNYYGVYCYNSNGNSFVNNSITFNNVNGIQLDNSCKNTEINNNTITNNWSSGIYLQPGNDNTSISNNFISNNVNFGIYIIQSNTITLKNNSVIYCQTGFKFYQSYISLAIENKAINNTFGFYFQQDYWEYPGANIFGIENLNFFNNSAEYNSNNYYVYFGYVKIEFVFFSNFRINEVKNSTFEGFEISFINSFDKIVLLDDMDYSSIVKSNSVIEFGTSGEHNITFISFDQNKNSERFKILLTTTLSLHDPGITIIPKTQTVPNPTTTQPPSTSSSTVSLSSSLPITTNQSLDENQQKSTILLPPSNHVNSGLNQVFNFIMLISILIGTIITFNFLKNRYRNDKARTTVDINPLQENIQNIHLQKEEMSQIDYNVVQYQKSPLKMTTICIYCSNIVLKEDKFCHNCGNRL